MNIKIEIPYSEGERDTSSFKFHAGAVTAYVTGGTVTFSAIPKDAKFDADDLQQFARVLSHA